MNVLSILSISELHKSILCYIFVINNIHGNHSLFVSESFWWMTFLFLRYSPELLKRKFAFSAGIIFSQRYKDDFHIVWIVCVCGGVCMCVYRHISIPQSISCCWDTMSDTHNLKKRFVCSWFLEDPVHSHLTLREEKHGGGSGGRQLFSHDGQKVEREKGGAGEGSRGSSPFQITLLAIGLHVLTIVN